MDVPGIVEEALDGEEVAADVDLGGDDALFVTSTRTLIYRSEGLLSDESVESYSHEAESLSISEGRRKTRITLEHPIEGVEDFTLPSGAADEAIPAILAGVLRANDVLTEGESVVDTYLFSELTLVITDDRLVKHVGETVWDLEFEEYPFADVTAVYAEKGSVATQLIVELDGRAERIKTPSDRSRAVRETLEDALRRHHGLTSDEDLNDALGPAEPAEPEPEPTTDDASASTGGMDFGEGVEPLSAGDTTQDGRNPDPRDLEAAAGESTAPDPEGERASGAAPVESSSQEAATREQPTQESAPQDPASGDSSEQAPADREGGTNAGAPGADGPATGSESADGRSGDAPAASTEQGDVPVASTEQGDAPAGSESREPADAAGSEAGSAADGPAGSPEGGSAPGDPDELEDAGFESATDPTAELAEEVAELRVAVQKQNKLLARQHKTIEKLVEELRRGR